VTAVRLRGVFGAGAAVVLTVSWVGPDHRSPVAGPAGGVPSRPPATVSTSVAPDPAPQQEIEVSRLAPGQQPPQFVVVSFDGSCGDELFRHYLDVAERNSARFTFFLSGLCLLPDEQRETYDPPLKDPGSSAIGFGSADQIPALVRNLSTAYSRGHEIGTHALGHFCGGGGVDDWDADDWRSELAQFRRIVDNWRANLDPELSAGVSPLPFNSSVVQGIRTPCLQGDREVMWPVWEEAGFTYDASNPGSIGWPVKIDGHDLWEFPLQMMPVSGFDRGALSMDYNFMCVQNGCSKEAGADEAAQIEASTYDSFMAATRSACDGSRTPLFLGNHFNTWVDGAYRDALTRYVDDAASACPDVQFVSNRDLVRWLDAQDPAVLEELRAKGA
jgi:hypothetical protein